MNLKLVLGGVLAVVVLASIYLAVGGSPLAFADDASPVLYFYSDTCQFCLKQKPILEELSAEGYRVKLMDVGRNTALWRQYNISGTPTFIADNGKGERLVGLTPKDQLRAFFDQNGAKIAAA
ncbi:MAG: thioredoxin family protein [Candidatus Micrarchaeota archaeon]|nr:thioredoxin family protein [Candidatus Micrarchaeota archaeon]